MIGVSWITPTNGEPPPVAVPLFVELDVEDGMVKHVVLTVDADGCLWEDSWRVASFTVDDILRYVPLDRLLEVIVDGEEYNAVWAKYLEIRKWTEFYLRRIREHPVAVEANKEQER